MKSLKRRASVPCFISQRPHCVLESKDFVFCSTVQFLDWISALQKSTKTVLLTGHEAVHAQKERSSFKFEKKISATFETPETIRNIHRRVLCKTPTLPSMPNIAKDLAQARNRSFKARSSTSLLYFLANICRILTFHVQVFFSSSRQCLVWISQLAVDRLCFVRSISP